MIKYFMERGARVDARNAAGQTPIEFAKAAMERAFAHRFGDGMCTPPSANKYAAYKEHMQTVFELLSTPAEPQNLAQPTVLLSKQARPTLFADERLLTKEAWKLTDIYR